MMPKLCLFDASGYLHRAYHAVPPLTTSKGEPVNAVYGFTRMISKALKEERPTHVAVCFDTAAPTFRHRGRDVYKANRKETDGALMSQMPIAEELARAWGLPCLKKDGFEADDIIATLALAAQQAGIEVLIFSGDKDMLQLVSPGIVVRDEMRRIDYTEEKVREKYGVSPVQLLDWFALTGDKIDNVIGVPGVGPVTATKLIATHGSLETLFASLDTEKQALADKIRAHREHVLQNRIMVKLCTDVCLEVALDDISVKEPNQQKMRALLERLEFKSGVYGFDYDASLAPTPANAAQPNTRRQAIAVLTANDLECLKNRLSTAATMAYDVETDGLNTRMCGLVGVSLSIQADEAWYIPVGHRYLGMPAQLPWADVKAVLKPLLESASVLKIGHNVKFDNAVLACNDIRVSMPMVDTMVAAYCLNPSRLGYGLKDLAADFLQEKMTRIDELIGKGKAATFDQVSVEHATPYAAADAEVTWRLWEWLSARINDTEAGRLFFSLEMPLVSVIEQMEENGIHIDRSYLKEVGRLFEERRQEIEKEIHSLAGEEFVINSPKQLSRILFEKLKLPVIKKTKTGFSTDEDVLLKLAAQHPICEKILASRELSKLTSTYVDSLLGLVDPNTSRVHTTFQQTGTATGRLSSSNPNLQNIPIRTENGRQIRRAFTAPTGKNLVSADYSQIDLRALAHMSADPALGEAFQRGGDIHQATAADIFHVPLNHVTPDMRRQAKAINFGVVYGQQAFALSQSLGITMEAAKDFIKRYFERYSGLKTWMEQVLADARKNGFVSTLSGRRRYVPDILSSNMSARGFAERIAVNTPIQGTSADIIKAAMIRIPSALKEKGLNALMLLQVHDELVFEVSETETALVSDVVRHEMETAWQLRVPLVVDVKVGKNWNDMDKLKPVMR